MILSFNFKNFFSPMPRTFMRSSIRSKGPFFSRNSRMRFAVDVPMPGSSFRSSSVAWFKLILRFYSGSAQRAEAQNRNAKTLNIQVETSFFILSSLLRFYLTQRSSPKICKGFFQRPPKYHCSRRFPQRAAMTAPRAKKVPNGSG